MSNLGLMKSWHTKQKNVIKMAFVARGVDVELRKSTIKNETINNSINAFDNDVELLGVEVLNSGQEQSTDMALSSETIETKCLFTRVDNSENVIINDNFSTKKDVLFNNNVYAYIDTEDKLNAGSTIKIKDTNQVMVIKRQFIAYSNSNVFIYELVRS